MHSFKKWRIWLLQETEIEVARSHGITFFKDGTPTQILRGGTYMELEDQITSEIRFLERFANLCKSFGFDPRVESHWQRFQIEEGRLVREPQCGVLTVGTAENCYAFYFDQKHRIKRERELKLKLRDAFKKRKPRLPNNIAKVLVYALEKNRGSNLDLNRIRNYLTAGAFDRDLIQVSKSIRKKIRHYNNTQASKIPMQSVYIPTNSISKLSANRGEDNTHRWRAIWLHDLYRLIASSPNEPIIKKISEKKKSEIRTEILKFGDAKMFKNRIL